MQNIKNEYQINKIKASLESLYVIVANSNEMIANVAIISAVEVIDTDNELILELADNIKNTEDEIFFKVHNVFYKLTLKIVFTNVSKEILKSYMAIHQGRINYAYELFEFGRFGSKVKQIRTSNTSETFLEWYNADRETSKKISTYDGIWISSNYLNINQIMPPSVEVKLSKYLFEMFNNSKLFTSNGSYKVNNKHYVTVNGIVITDLKKLIYLDNYKIIGTDKFDKEFVINCNKDKNQDSSNTA